MTCISTTILLHEILSRYRTSTAKQVLGNCERMVFASFVGNFNFESFNPNFLYTCAVNFYLMILVVNLYIVLVYCYTMLLGYTFVNFQCQALSYDSGC